MEYICVANCPELDANGDMHCKCADISKLNERYPDSGGCPCGNIPMWVNMEEFQ